MAKKEWKPGNMLYPVPAVLVTSRSADGKDDVCTVAWAGTVCTNPPMVSISLRKSRLTYDYVSETGVFVINLTTEKLARATDFCGVRSGRDLDKFAEMQLTKEEAAHISCPMLAESPVSIECEVTEAKDLGSHTMFLAEVKAVHADEACLDEQERFDLMRAHPIVYSHGAYCSLGKQLGTFGWSVRKKKSSGKPRMNRKIKSVKKRK
ncbi:MAG: flavin reductase family protein [Lachnospiraceae bacterium]|nr:flavin reductase family protein [Lachnospiraceae bacterium]